MKGPRNRLRVIRYDRKKPISQVDLAFKAKLSTTRYWRIEKGYVIPTAEERERIARALGVTVQDAFPPGTVATPVTTDAAVAS